MFNEMTDEDRKKVTNRLTDMAIQVRDLLCEIGKLKQEVCAHRFEVDPDGGIFCRDCMKLGSTESITITVERRIVK